jgi:parallel beta-helix repeat protein
LHLLFQNEVYMHILIVCLFLALMPGNRDTSEPLAYFPAFFMQTDLVPDFCSCESVGDTLFVTQSTDSGEGSLRCALECAALTGGREIIAFDFSPGQDSLIELLSPLPSIPSNTWIINDDDKVIIEGGALSNQADHGLRINGDSVIIKGLSLQNFPNNAIDNFLGYDEVVIENNVLKNNGRLSLSGDGIDFRLSQNFIIRNNSILSNSKDGINLQDCRNGVLLSNNISYNQNNGINLYNSTNLKVGDHCENCGNVITGNLENGIKAWQNSSHLEFYNNYIGINGIDVPPIPNGENGIFLSHCDTVNIGGLNAGNYIAGNVDSGIKMVDSTHHLSVQNNVIGLSNIVELGLPNGSNGIEMSNSFDVLIGGENKQEGNMIGYQAQHVSITDSSQRISLNSNQYRCSSNSFYIEAGSNMDQQTLEDFNIISTTQIGGSCNRPLFIQAYRKSPDCTLCQGNEFLGSIQSPGGTWEITLDYPLEEGDEVALLITDEDGNSSDFSACQSFTCDDFSVQIIPVGQEYICMEGSLELTTDGGETFLWSTGETTPVITISQGGQYSVRVWDEKGCPSPVDSINIPTFANPNLSISPVDSTVFCDDYIVINAQGQGRFEWNTGHIGPVLMAEESGEYCVSLTNQYNCVSTACVSITKGEEVEASINVLGDTSFCEGNTIWLQAEGGSMYEWNGSNSQNDSIQVSESGIYSVTVTNEYGCVDSASQLITVYPEVDAYISPAGYQIICPGDSIELNAFGGNQYLWNTGTDSSSIIVTDWGNYSVTVSNEYGCYDVVSQSISVKPRILLDIEEDSPLEICDGESVWLHATYQIMDSIVWNQEIESDSIMVADSGLYHVEVFNLGCSEKDSIEVILLDKPSPVDSIHGLSWSHPDSVQFFSLLSYDSNLEYLWEVDGGVIISETIEGVEVLWERDDFGLICVTVIDSNACSSESYCRMIDLAPLNIQSVRQGSVILYPNPANGFLTIESDNVLNDQHIQLEFFNPNGILLAKREIDFSSALLSSKINIAEIPPGIYWVRIKVGNKVIGMKKILLNR